MAIRKISVPVKPIKPVVVGDREASIKALAKDLAKKQAVQVPAQPAKPKTERITHDVASLYTGDSCGLNKRKSTTVLDLSLFGSKPDYILSERTELVAETIKKQYGNKPFPRANLDAGILKHLLLKGFVEAVSGQGGEDTTLRFTKQGLAYHRKTA